MKNNQGIIIIVAVIACIASFVGGMKYDQIRRQNSRGSQGFSFRTNQGSPNGSRPGMNGRPVLGEIISKDDKSITVKTQDGGSRIVFFSGSTSVSKTAEGTMNDLNVGTTVGVFGTENTDKSVTAQNIQINPQFRMSTNSGQPGGAGKSNR